MRVVENYILIMNIQFPVSRLVDRLVLSSSIHILVYLGLVQMAINGVDGLVWLRCATAVAAFLPFHFWLVNEVIASDLRELQSSRRRSAFAYGLISVAFGVLPFTDFFIPSSSTGGRYGIGYYFYIVGVLGMYLGLGLDGFRRSKSLSGSRRFALRVWVGAGCAFFAVSILMTGLRAAMHNTGFQRAQPLILLGCFAWVALALTANRTFTARRFPVVALEKAISVAIMGAVAFLLYRVLTSWISVTGALVAATVLALGFAVAMKGWWDRLFRLFPQDIDARPGPTS